MLSTLPWTPKPEPLKSQRVRKLQFGPRFEPLVASVAKFLDRGEPTRFRYEGAMRHGLRAALCLQGRDWCEADWFAAVIVAAALAKLAVERPTWLQGQAEFTALPGFAPAERYFCARCAGPMSEGRRLYCSWICARSAHNERTYRELREMSEAEREAMKMLRRQLKSDYFAARRTITCRWCGGLHEYKAGANARTYCSRTCAAKARHSQIARLAPDRAHEPAPAPGP